MTRNQIMSYWRGLAPSWRGRYPLGALSEVSGVSYDQALEHLIEFAGRRYAAVTRGDLIILAAEYLQERNGKETP